MTDKNHGITIAPHEQRFREQIKDDFEFTRWQDTAFHPDELWVAPSKARPRICIHGKVYATSHRSYLILHTEDRHLGSFRAGNTFQHIIYPDQDNLLRVTLARRVFYHLYIEVESSTGDKAAFMHVGGDQYNGAGQHLFYLDNIANLYETNHGPANGRLGSVFGQCVRGERLNITLDGKTILNPGPGAEGSQAIDSGPNPSKLGWGIPKSIHWYSKFYSSLNVELFSLGSDQHGGASNYTLYLNALKKR